jgi:hypothetical protein
VLGIDIHEDLNALYYQQYLDLFHRGLYRTSRKIVRFDRNSALDAHYFSGAIQLQRPAAWLQAIPGATQLRPKRHEVGAAATDCRVHLCI